MSELVPNWMDSKRNRWKATAATGETTRHHSEYEMTTTLQPVTVHLMFVDCYPLSVSSVLAFRAASAIQPLYDEGVEQTFHSREEEGGREGVSGEWVSK